jgi:hypothetical protein
MLNIPANEILVCFNRRDVHFYGSLRNNKRASTNATICNVTLAKHNFDNSHEEYHHSTSISSSSNSSNDRCRIENSLQEDGSIKCDYNNSSSNLLQVHPGERSNANINGLSRSSVNEFSANVVIDPILIAKAVTELPTMLVRDTDHLWTTREVERMCAFVPAAQGARRDSFYWYNDQIINEHLCQMQDRDNHQCTLDTHKKPTIFLNSFFMTRLLFTDNHYNYENVRRWTKKITPILESEKICTIISLPGHWSVITVLVEQKRIEYYDHYNRNSEEGRQCLGAMKQWVADEVKDKQGGMILDMRDWECEDMSCKIPIYAQQTDAHSCGPFAVRCLELITSNLLWVQARWYSQEDMQVYYRNRGLVAIYRGKCDC